MTEKTMRLAILVATVSVLAAATTVAAQTNATGRIAGRVTDHEATLPGVTLILAAGPLQRREVSDVDGRYAFDALPVDATYVLSAQLPGFGAQVFRDLSVTAGRTTSVPIRVAVSCDGATIVDYISLGFEDALLTNDIVIHIRVDENSVGDALPRPWRLSRVRINDFGARGEELRLESPAGRESSVANLTGVRADAGVAYTVADVVVDGSDAGLRDVWVRLRPK